MSICTEYEACRGRLYFTHDFARPSDGKLAYAEAGLTQTPPFLAFKLKDDKRFFLDVCRQYVEPVFTHSSLTAYSFLCQKRRAWYCPNLTLNCLIC